jgi:hypothetical protein
MFSSAELRAMAKFHRSIAEICADPLLREEHLKIAKACDECADDKAAEDERVTLAPTEMP